MKTVELLSLTDVELSARIVQMAVSERRITGELLRHLAEYDARKVFKRDGNGTLWNYCSRVLKFSEAEIKLRVQAARAVRRNEKLMGMLERGETTVAAIGRLAPHLHGEKADELIEQIRGRSRREVEWIVAKENVTVKAELSQIPATEQPPSQDGLFEPMTPDRDDIAIRAELRDRRDRVIPISGDEAEIRFVASRVFVEKLEQARVLLARSDSSGDFEGVLGAALELLLEKRDPGRRHARRQARANRRKREQEGKVAIVQPNTANDRLVRGALRDEILGRDGNRCTAALPDGARCPEQRWLEIDHIIPAAMGGETSRNNLRTLCRHHNQMAATATFGMGNIQTAIRDRKEARERALSP